MFTNVAAALKGFIFVADCEGDYYKLIVMMTNRGQLK